jgi:uncharacterized iron-regulated membrane protein
LILLLAVTGLVWTFDWWKDGIYRILGNDPEKVFAKSSEIEPDSIGYDPNSFDRIIAASRGFQENWSSIGLSIPAVDSSAQRVFTFLRFHSGKSGWDESHQLVFNSATGKLHFAMPHTKKTLGAKWRNSNYAIHVGSIYGLPTKILAFLTSLFCASMPVTGFLIWWGRRKKQTLALRHKAVLEKEVTLNQMKH